LPEVLVPDLQRVGTPVPAADVTAIVIDSPGVSFGLAVFTSMNEATYPAISTDGGVSWRIDGPEFYAAAAQAANNTSEVGALPPYGAYVWGQGGNAVRVTTDEGVQWWVTGFAYGVYGVSKSDGTIRTVALGPQQNDGTFEAYLYVSADSGHSWRLHGQLPNVKLGR